MSLDFDPAIITSTSLLTLHDKHSVSDQHVVPGADPDLLSTYTIPASGIVLLREQPLQQQVAIPTGVTVTQVPGGPFTETLSSPSTGQFQVNYSNGSIAFHSADVGKNVLIGYTATGSIVRASHVNNIAKPLVPFYNKLNGIVPDGGTDFTFPNDVTITGDLNILGVVNRLSSEVIDISDNIIVLNFGVTDDGPGIGDKGLEIARSVNPQGDPTHPQMVWQESNLAWSFNSTSAGPTGSRAPLLKVYNKGGVQVTKLTAAQETTLVGTLVAGDAGLQWFNTTTSQFMGWNGTAAVILG